MTLPGHSFCLPHCNVTNHILCVTTLPSNFLCLTRRDATSRTPLPNSLADTFVETFSLTYLVFPPKFYFSSSSRKQRKNQIENAKVSAMKTGRRYCRLAQAGPRNNFLPGARCQVPMTGCNDVKRSPPCHALRVTIEKDKSKCSSTSPPFLHLNIFQMSQSSRL